MIGNIIKIEFNSKDMNNRKGQAATEYLITYGWAIVVILAVMTILYSTVFKPEFYVAERCDMAPGVICDNFKLETINSNTVKLTLAMHNAMGFEINATSIDFALIEPGSQEDTLSSYTGAPLTQIRDGEELLIVQTFTVGKKPKSGSLYRIKFFMNFTNEDVSPSVTHRTAGAINVRMT